jgi:hypothetical protein
MSMMKTTALTLMLVSLICAGCATTGDDTDEPTLTDAAPPAEVAAAIEEAAPPADESSKQEEGEVPLPVAESERPAEAPSEPPEEVIVQATRHQVIHDLVAEAQTLLRDVELQYVFTGKGKNQVLRGRPVAFALWSDAKQEWSVAQIELQRPPIRWKPGRKPLPFRNLTPDIQARHVKGTGAERLMFSFSQDGNPLKVYGRKFPVFDNKLLKRKQWRKVVQTAKPIVYLPFTEDTFDPGFVSGGKEFLTSTARQAIEELRLAQVPSAAFPEKLLADAIPLQVVTTLAVIEQTDDKDYVEKQALAFDSGATNLLNAMKAAVCLLDLELAAMRAEIRLAYLANPAVLGIFPVAAYNGGPRNVTKLYRVLTRMKVDLDELSLPGVHPEGSSVTCPCVWKTDGTNVRPLAIPKYNNENRWYIEKYQSIVTLFE